MDVWLLVVYAAASFLALRSLVSLMASHKAHYKQQMVADEVAKRKAARKQADSEQLKETKETSEAAA